mgnify:CR=1 FL=1
MKLKILEKPFRHLDIVVYRTRAQLKAESQNNYLGYLWFVLEPALMTAVLYFVFGFLMGNRGPEMVLFILTGILIFQWFNTAFNAGIGGIRAKIGILRTIAIPKYLFPLVNILAESWKFFWVFLVLVLLANLIGFPVNEAYLHLPLLSTVMLLFIVGMTLPFSVIVAFMPDFTTLTNSVLRLLFFLSGIFYGLEVVPENLHSVFLSNPIALLMNGYRAILIEGVPPDGGQVFYCFLWGIVGLGIGMVGSRLADGRIIKAVSQ